MNSRNAKNPELNPEPYTLDMTWQRSLLVLEDEPLIGTLVSSVLGEKGFRTATCTSAVEAKRYVELEDPDGVLIDINLGPGPNGLQFGEWLHMEHPDVVQVYLTATQDPRIWGAQPKGQKHWLSNCTFLAKDKLGDSVSLVAAINQAFAEQPSQTFAAGFLESPLRELSRAELDVLRLATLGFTNAAIAKQRNSALRTVEQQLQAVYRALGVADTADKNARVDAVRIFLHASGSHHA